MALPKTNRFKAEAIFMLVIMTFPLILAAIVLAAFYLRNVLSGWAAGCF